MRPAARAARPAEPPVHAAAPTALLRDVVVLGAVWGSSVMFQRMAVAEVPPLPLVVLRLAGADPLAMAAGQIVGGLLVSVPVTLLAGETVALDRVSVQAWVAIVASGAVGLGAAFVLFLGMIERHGPTASLLALYVMPVAAATLGALFLDETIAPSMAVGGVLVLLGVVLFTRRGR